MVWIAGCSAAAIWQVGRAFQGNTLSYLYSFEWPFFGVLGIWGWWALLHVDPVAPSAAVTDASAAPMPPTPLVPAEEHTDDPTLDAYNAHLARLAAQPKRRIWGH